jgi:hypothetical protein
MGTIFGSLAESMHQDSSVLLHGVDVLAQPKGDVGHQALLYMFHLAIRETLILNLEQRCTVLHKNFVAYRTVKTLFRNKFPKRDNMR